MRLFDLPLFEAGSPTSFRLFGRQQLADGGVASLWYADGYPDVLDEWSATADGVSWLGGRAAVGIGDIVLATLRPRSFAVPSRDQITVRGGELTVRWVSWSGQLFAGKPRFWRRPPSGPQEPPFLAGIQAQRESGLWAVGLGLTAVRGAVVAGDPEPREAGVAAIRLCRSFWDRGHFFGELEGTGDGAAGGRVGAQLTGARANLTGYLYRYATRFPWAYPLYRPGESGLDLSGAVRSSEWTTIYGRLNLLEDRLSGRGEQLRGHLGATVYRGTERPSVTVEFARDELSSDVRTIGPSDRTVDRVVGALSWSTSTRFATVRGEQLFEDGDRGRAQLVAFGRAALSGNRFADGSAVVQREPGGDLGITVEAAADRPWRGRLSVLAGAGIAYRRVDGREQGEGLVRLGLVRRLRGEGLTLRIEGVVPFDVGLERSGLTRRRVAVDVGYAVGWRRPEDLRSALAPVIAPRSFGRLDGRVVSVDGGLGGVPVLVGGTVATVTAGDGRFSVRRVPVGPVRVSIDLGGHDPRLAVAPPAEREVKIRPRETTIVEIGVVETSVLQGAVVTCGADGGIRPLPGVRLVLLREGWRAETVTSNLGGFQFDRTPPGHYMVEIDPSSVPAEMAAEAGAPVPVDLETDRTGFVIRLGCP